MNALTFRRSFTSRVFWGEDVPIHLEVVNQSWLPVVWLRLQESLPTELATPKELRQVISLGPRERGHFEYLLRARKRGYYPVGPLFVASGDIFGLAGDLRQQVTSEHLTVYPKIIHLSDVKMPSRSPMGTLRHYQPIFEDPTRIIGKRDYVVGDSLRRVDWKASANTGKLQVRQYEPSIALETAIFLDFNRNDYEARGRTDAIELAVIVAASLASWVVKQKQSVGLLTNGVDPISDQASPTNELQFKPLLPRPGRGHLMRVLDVLARVESTEQTLPFVDLLRQESVNLAWGTTLILITGKVGERFFDELFRSRRLGLNAVIILIGQVAGMEEIKNRADHFRFPLLHFYNEMDLDVWRK